MRGVTSADRGRRRRLILAAAVLCAGAGGVGVAGAAPAGPSTELPQLPPAESWTDQGVSQGLEERSGEVRVRILLTSQPVLEAASSDQFQELAQPALDPATQRAAALHPGRITEVEKDSAEAAEESYEGAVATLDDESAEASAEVASIAAAIEGEGGEVLGEEVVPAAVVARVEAGSLQRIQGIAGVQTIEAAPVEKPQMDVSVQASGAPSWWAAGFTGGEGGNDQVPADVATQDEAPDPTHPAFSGVTLDISPNEDPGDHGTHVAGVIVSQDTTFRGVAYGADRLIGANSEPYALGVTDGDGNPGAVDPAEVINRSFGGSGAEDADRGVDVTTHLFGVGRAESAGNSNVDGSPTVENLGRNMVSVGAFNDVNTVTSTDDVVLGISSRGPTPGGRKKPDITAPGGSIVSPTDNWETGPDFNGETGTSFSSPHVAGAMTLLEGSGITDAMAQRALLINSARDWNGTNTGLSGWTTGTQTGWRPEVGWGELDLTTALAQRANYELGEVAEGEAAFYRATMPAGGKATMAFELRGIWPEYPANGSQPTVYTQSDLNLRQYTAAGSEIAPPAAFDPPMTTIDPGPNAIDTNDTVEQTRTPSAQTVTFKVESASEIDGANAEPFAIAAAADLQPLVSPVTRPNDSDAAPSTTVACDQAVTVSTELVNDSPDLDSTASAVTLELPAGVELTSGSATQSVSGGTLEAGTTSETKTWTVEATTDGPHVLTIAGVGEGLGTPFRRTETVNLTSDCVAPETAIGSGPNGPTNDSTPSFAFTGSGGPSGFECSVDGGAFSPCSSAATIGPLGVGPHSFSVRARDAAGNRDATPATRSFTVDTAAPDTAITSGPSGPTNDRSPAFGLSSEGGASFECSLDSGPFGACSSPYVVQVGPGAHQVRARAVDAAGNVDATPALRQFAVDGSVEGAKLCAKKAQNFKDELALKAKVVLGEAGKAKVSVKVDLGSKSVDAKDESVSFARAGKEAVTLGASAAVNRQIDKALNGGKVVAEVRATFTDELGNRAQDTRKVTLR